jgi:hypothetical protein
MGAARESCGVHGWRKRHFAVTFLESPTVVTVTMLLCGKVNNSTAAAGTVKFHIGRVIHYIKNTVLQLWLAFKHGKEKFVNVANLLEFFQLCHALTP